MSRFGGLTSGATRAIARIGGFVGLAQLWAAAQRHLDTPAMRDAVADTWEEVRAKVHWYAGSMVAHMVIFGICLLILGRMHSTRPEAPPVSFVPVNDDLRPRPPLEQIELAAVTPLETSELTTDDLLHPQYRSSGEVALVGNPDAGNSVGGGRPIFTEPYGGGMGGFAVPAVGPGPKILGKGGIGAGLGTGDQSGSGGNQSGFFGRTPGMRGQLARGGGGTRQTEVAVIAALNWFARHANTDGSWSLSRFASHCTGPACSGPGSADSDVAATAVSLLPFLAAGQTHKSKGPYQPLINQGIFWLLRHQVHGGNLAASSPVAQMYAHALATITLCEAYGMTKDPKLFDPAAQAVAFIEQAQNTATGGWRYFPHSPDSDTSVLGWQIMALHSAQLAGIPVHPTTLANAKRWLGAVCKGNYRGLYSYQEVNEATPTMTAIGMLSSQYLGMMADDPAMVEGKRYLLANLPDNGRRDTYYWYYATQVMHNLLGHDWDTWNHQMRKALVETQCRHDCAAGSWDPEYPTLDTWGPQGGRILTTAFSTLTLEVYYRYLPLYQNGGSASDPIPPSVTSATPTDAAKATVQSPF